MSRACHAVSHAASHARCHAVTTPVSHGPVTPVVTVPPTRPDPLSVPNLGLSRNSACGHFERMADAQSLTRLLVSEYPFPDLIDGYETNSTQVGNHRPHARVGSNP